MELRKEEEVGREGEWMGVEREHSIEDTPSHYSLLKPHLLKSHDVMGRCVDVHYGKVCECVKV